jgi:hypothetical protein
MVNEYALQGSSPFTLFLSPNLNLVKKYTVRLPSSLYFVVSLHIDSL